MLNSNQSIIFLYFYKIKLNFQLIFVYGLLIKILSLIGNNQKILSFKNKTTKNEINLIMNLLKIRFYFVI